jgi:hypothetical protein
LVYGISAPIPGLVPIPSNDWSLNMTSQQHGYQMAGGVPVRSSLMAGSFSGGRLRKQLNRAVQRRKHMRQVAANDTEQELYREIGQMKMSLPGTNERTATVVNQYVSERAKHAFQWSRGTATCSCGHWTLWGASLESARRSHAYHRANLHDIAIGTEEVPGGER